MTSRAGFLVKNTEVLGGLVALAEPDAGDFLQLGNHRFGVISGGVTSTAGGMDVSVSPTVLVINGQVVLSAGGLLHIFSGAVNPRYDLIAMKAPFGDLVVLRGTPATTPVFPDFDDQYVVLASVYVASATTTLADVNITDKRVMLPQKFVTALASGTLLSNSDPASGAVKFAIDAAGKLTWSGGAVITASTNALTLTGALGVTGPVTTGPLNVHGDTLVNGNVVSDDMQVGHGEPSAAGTLGHIYRDLDTGHVWVYQVIEGGGVAWQVLSASTIPVGVILTTFSAYADPGFLMCDGQSYSATLYPSLAARFPTWVNVSGLLTVPNLSGRFLRQGTPGSTGGASQVQLQTQHLPRHRHISGAAQTAAGGPHTHNAQVGLAGRHQHATLQGGSHGHVVTEPPHDHAGPFGNFIVSQWGGGYRIDGPFNDASHPVAVASLSRTAPSTTGLTVSGGGPHAHNTDENPDHTHTVTISQAPETHTHPIAESDVGSDAPFDITPPFYGVNYMVRAV